MDQQAVNGLDSRTDELSRADSAPLQTEQPVMPNIGSEEPYEVAEIPSESAPVTPTVTQLAPTVPSVSNLDEQALNTPSTDEPTIAQLVPEPPAPVVVSDAPKPEQPTFGYRVVEPPAASAFEFSDDSLDSPEVMDSYQPAPQPSVMRHWFVRPFSSARTVLIAAIFIAVFGSFVGYGIHVLRQKPSGVNSADLKTNLPQETVANSALAKNQTLKINSKLQVDNNTQLNGDLNVTGTTTLQGVVVKADAIVGGNLTVQGNGTFSGEISASNFSASSLTVTQNSDFTGTLNAANITSSTISISGSLDVGGTIVAENLQGTFTGSFVGNGSGITDLSALNCQDCVRLQGTNPIAQTGNVSLAGDATVAGVLTGRNLHIQPVIDSTTVAQVQDASGTNVLNIDTTHRQITVSDLLPQTAGTVQAGSTTPGIDTSTAVAAASANEIYNDNAHWSAKGQDGLLRFTYIDWVARQVHYVRCQNTDCTTNVNAVIETDATNGLDSPSFALDQAGNAYITYVDYSSPNEWHLAHCLDQDCASTTIQTIGVSSQYSYNGALTVDGQGLADLVYDTYDYSGSPTLYGLQFVHCTNTDCSTRTTTNLASSDSNSGGRYYETSAITTGVDGLPRIAYVFEGDNSIQYVKCTNADCTTSTTNPITGPGIGDYWLSLAVGSDDLAKIVYEGASPNYYELDYAACGDAACASATTSVLIPQTDVINGGEADIVLTANNLPVISAYDQPTASPTRQFVYIYCADAQCSSPNVRALDQNASGGYAYSSSVVLGANGFAQIVYPNYNGTSYDMKVATLGTLDGNDIVIPSVQTDGTNVGSPSQLFGQIYAQGLNLQSASSGAALVINQQGVINGTGSIASFQINGQEKVGIDNTGNLIVQGAIVFSDGSSQTSAGNYVKNGTAVQSANFYIQTADPTATTATIQAVSGQTSSLLQAKDSGGNTIFDINARGSLVVGSTSACVGCAPGYVKGSVPTGGWPQNIKIVGNYAYVSNNSGPTLQVFDISNPSSPRLVSSVGTDDSANFLIEGNYLYMAITDPFNGVETFDISNPLNPTLISTISSNTGDVFDIAKSGNYLYALSRSGIRTMDFTDPAAPTDLGFLYLSNGLDYGDSSIGISGTHVYVLNVYEQLLFSVDISDPSNPTFVSQISTEGPGLYFYGDNLVINGNYLYFSTGQYDGTGKSFKVVDISNPASMQIVGRAATVNNGGAPLPNGNYLSKFTQISGNYAYVASPQGFDVFDITSPTNPKNIDNSVTGNYLIGFTFANGNLYSLDAIDNVLRIYGYGSSQFNGGVKAAGLEVSGLTSLNSLNVSGPATIKQSTLVVTGVSSTPTISGVYLYPFGSGGTLSGQASTTYYYRMTAVSNGQESLPSAEYAVNGASAYPLYDYGGYSLSPVSGGAGALTGTFMYKYTYVSANGETDGNSPSSPITVNGESVFLDNLYSNPYSGAIAKNIYRCDVSACVYKKIGTINDDSITSFTDNNPVYGSTIPTTNTATTNNNTAYMYFAPVNGVSSYNIYRSTTAGGPYTVFSSLPPNPFVGGPSQGFYADSGVVGTTGTPPTYSHIGQVGIGTDSPKANLHVAGTALFQNATNSTNAFQVNDSSGSGVLNVDTTGHNVTVGGTLNTQAVVVGGTSNGIKANWYNSDPGTYKTVGSGTLATSYIDGPINWTDLNNTRPAGVNHDYINADFTGYIKADHTETYTFYTASDDGSRLYIGGNLVVDNWFDQGVTERSGTVNLVAGQIYPIEVQFYQGAGGAAVYASWSSPSTPKALIPADHLFTSSSGGITIKGSAGQTSPSLQVQDSNGNVLSSIGADGAVLAGSGSATSVPLSVKGFAGQLADLIQAKDSSGNVLFKVDNNGNLTVGANGAMLSTQAAATNYLPDPTFANGAAGGRGSGTKQLVTGQAGTATGRAVKLTPNNDWTTVGENCSVGSNGTYTMSFIAWTTSGTSTVQVLEGPSNFISSITATTTPQRYSLSWNHTSGCNSFEIGPNGGTNPVFVADWQVEQGSLGTAFIYGSAGSGYAWTGTVNNSSSTRAAGLYVNNGLFLQSTFVAKSATFNGDLTLNGHIITGNTSGSTTATVGAAAGTGGTCTLSGNDTSGVVTIVTGGSGVATGVLCTVNFASAYAVAPHTVLSPANAASTGLQVYKTNNTINFVLSTNNAPAISTTYKFDYVVQQ